MLWSQYGHLGGRAKAADVRVLAALQLMSIHDQLCNPSGTQHSAAIRMCLLGLCLVPVARAGHTVQKFSAAVFACHTGSYRCCTPMPVNTCAGGLPRWQHLGARRPAQLLIWQPHLSWVSL